MGSVLELDVLYFHFKFTWLFLIFFKEFQYGFNSCPLPRLRS
jgi:hypothetical protein